MQFSLRTLANRTECFRQFRLAMPAIMNSKDYCSAHLCRKAVSQLRPTFEANGMVRSQRVWGGSHDVILGHMLWLHRMPTYPISFGYRSDRMKTGVLNKLDNRYAEVLMRAIIIHDVRILNHRSFFCLVFS